MCKRHHKRNVRKLYLYMMVVVMVLVSCDMKFRLGDSEASDRIVIQRYDRLESRYLTTGDFSALQQMNTSYPMETRTLVEDVLKLGEVNEPHINNKFLSFFQDSTLQTIISDAEAQYANVADINEQLNVSFGKLRTWIPDIPIPDVYLQIGALDQSIIVGEKMIGISIDKYLGKDYPLYARFYSESQRQSMGRGYIVPDCLTFYLLSLYPMEDFDRRTQLEKDLHMAKVMWVANRALPRPVFHTRYIDMVGRYMQRNQKVSIRQLLESNDYSNFK